MLLAVMNLSTVLQLEGAEGFQGPQQNLEKDSNEKSSDEKGYVSNESILHSLSSGGYKLFANKFSNLQGYNIISTQSGHTEEIRFPVFHRITSWMLSFFSRMERAKAALSSVDKQMLEG